MNTTKRLMHIMFTCLVISAKHLPLIADSETIGTYTWHYEIRGTATEICGYSSNGTILPATSPFPTDAITIPSSLGGNPVTSIGAHAFYRCNGVTSVTIPNSVTNIDRSAFSNCGLKSVTIPNSVTSIGEYAFSNCGLKNVTIPNSVTSIGGYAFRNCSGLTSVTIGGSVTNIGDYAFDGCGGLTNVTIGSSVTRIGNYAFQNCSGLTSVTIPNSVSGIATAAFKGCSGLTSVTIPDGLTKIVYSVFAGCSGLTSVTIPEGVTEILDNAFDGCSGLTSVTIPDSVTSLSTTAFDGCGKLWTAWYRTLANSSAAGGGVGGGAVSVVTTVVQNVESPYSLTSTAADRAIASVTVSADCTIDSFLLKDGKVYDSVLYISNTADRAVTLTLPSGHVYKAIKGTRPLDIPANSQSILSITRVADNVFFVSREDLETIQ